MPKWEELYKVAQVLGPGSYRFGQVEVSNVINTSRGPKLKKIILSMDGHLVSTLSPQRVRTLAEQLKPFCSTSSKYFRTLETLFLLPQVN